MVYDPVKAHQYYEEHKKLKGRHQAKSKPSGGPKATLNSGGKKPPAKPRPSNAEQTRRAKARIGRLKGKVAKLEGALTKAMQALSEKHQSEARTKQKNSDGKTTVKERQAAKQYRDTHKSEIKAKAKKDASSSSGGGSSVKSLSEMSTTELVHRVDKLKSVLKDARQQLSAATKAYSSLAHSDVMATGLTFSGIASHSNTSRKESVKMEADFGGYATRNDVTCSDGRTILQDAFAQNDKMSVPLVYQHNHEDITKVLGHAVLENRTDGVYAHGYFNSTKEGQHAKELVKHGDVKWLSIFANNLLERPKAGLAHAKEVIRGNIREVSLVLAGANPGANIDFVNLVHSDGGEELFTEEAWITTGLDIEVAHAATATDTAPAEADGELTVQEILDTLTPEQDAAVYYLLSQALGDGGTSSDTAQHADGVDGIAFGENSESINDIMHSLNETQETAVYWLLSQALAKRDEDLAHSDTDEGSESEEEQEAETEAEESEPAEEVEGSESETEESEAVEAETNGDDGEEAAESENDNPDAGDESTDGTEAGDAVQHDNISQEDNIMSNVFDRSTASTTTGGTMTHSQIHLGKDEVQSLMHSVLEKGSLKRALQDYAVTKGVEIGGELQHGIENIEYLFPDSKTLEASPNFISRRMEWVDKVLNGVRKTPFARIKTIHADITAEDARARGYVKGEFKEEEFFSLLKRETTPQTVYKKQKLDRDDVIDIVDLDVIAFVKAEMKIMLNEEIAGAILIGDGRSNASKDKIKADKIRPIASDDELYVTTVNVDISGTGGADALVDAAIENRTYYKGTGMPTFFAPETTISKFLTARDSFGNRKYKTLADVAEELRCSEVVSVEVFTRTPDIIGIMVNLSDYAIGTDRGGEATMFDDFDLDYNQLRYLLETRLCGALVLPKSALVFRQPADGAVKVVPAVPAFDGTTLTVPTVTGVTYKNESGTTLTTGSPVTVTDANSPYIVKASADSGYYFENNAEDEWAFEVDQPGVA